MPILSTPFQTLNFGDIEAPSVTSPPEAPFKITTKSDTDIWRRPPSHDVYSAPVLFQHLQDVSKFESARVTFRLTTAFNTLYDQAGIAIRFPENEHWIKSGLEISSTEGTKSISTVAAGKWADWGLYPLPAELEGRDEVAVTVELKKTEEHGVWVYLVLDEERRIPLREITWAFAGEGEGKGVDIGAYCCRPSVKLNSENFTVEFEDFRVNVKA